MNAKTIKVPDDITVHVKSRKVIVKGSRGTLSRVFEHLAVDIQLENNGKKIKVVKWFGKHKELAAVNTVCSNIQNMFGGVTEGFSYKMRSVYAHFPINVTVSDQKDSVAIRNFLGEKCTRNVSMLPGVKIEIAPGQKDDLVYQEMMWNQCHDQLHFSISRRQSKTKISESFWMVSMCVGEHLSFQMTEHED